MKSKKGLTLEELIKALYDRVEELGEAEVASEIEGLKGQPEFAKLIELLVEQGQRSDVARLDKDREVGRWGDREMGRPFDYAQGRQGDRETTRPRDHETTRLPDYPTTRLPDYQTTRPGDQKTTLALFHSPEHEQHASPDYALESPRRVQAIISALRQRRLLEEPNCALRVSPPATARDLITVHDQAYVNFMRRYAEKGGGGLSRNTYVSRGSWNAALGAGGCALAAGEALRQGYDFAWALTRPAGHHAGPDFHGGFCLFNNAAILAQRLRGEGKVMILNWDVHASNGTKRIFYDDPRVLTLSLHQDPTHFFPGEGFAEEIGVSAGKGYSVNVPLPPGAGDEDYLAAFAAIVAPIYQQFAPDWLIVECGFDAHHRDPLGGQKLTGQGYYQMAQQLLRLRPSGIAFTLEGGYNVDTIGQLAAALVNALSGAANSSSDAAPREAVGRGDALSYDLVKGLSGVREKRAPVGASLEQVIAEVKQALRGYWRL